MIRSEPAPPVDGTVLTDLIIDLVSGKIRKREFQPDRPHARSCLRFRIRYARYTVFTSQWRCSTPLIVEVNCVFGAGDRPVGTSRREYYLLIANSDACPYLVVLHMDDRVPDADPLC